MVSVITGMDNSQWLQKGLNRFPRAASIYWGIEYGAEMRHRSDTGHRPVVKLDHIHHYTCMNLSVYSRALLTSARHEIEKELQLSLQSTVDGAKLSKVNRKSAQVKTEVNRSGKHFEKFTVSRCL
ncbi:hypothetical protein AV530_000590 [Patagioenas fasciata monilis]|uniref:Uncharacterized protein n=1 Tax=Patagioenas fasciata monilis TaxID=372326 RepID=A0A1V4IFT4_PATFA|nr:hypothetical protein AV530_000590 [Patagioenas fasciata monilis]